MTLNVTRSDEKFLLKSSNCKYDHCDTHTTPLDAAAAFDLQQELNIQLAEMHGLTLLNVPASEVLSGDIFWHIGMKSVEDADFVEDWNRDSTSIETLVKINLSDGESSLELTPDTRLWVARTSDG